MFRRLRKIAPAMLACVSVLFWGLAGAVPVAHGAAPKAASQFAHNHAHGHGHSDPVPGGEQHDGVAAVAPSDADNTAGGMDHCSLSGCSFAAVTPSPFGTVVYAFSLASAFAAGEDVPESGAAPPLRPPRFS